jgi:hypothetical protein
MKPNQKLSAEMIAAQPNISTADLEDISMEANWETPEPVISALLPIVSLTQDLIPGPLRAYVCDQADRMSCPPDNVFAPLMVTLSIAIGTGCGIRPKRFDPWLVVPNIWGAVVAPPGSKKTAALKAGTRFLEELEADTEEEFSKAERQYKADYAEFKANENRINSDMKSAAKPQKARYSGKGMKGGD